MAGSERQQQCGSDAGGERGLALRSRTRAVALTMVIALAGPSLGLGRVPLPEWSKSDGKKYADPGSAPLGVGLWPEGMLTDADTAGGEDAASAMASAGKGEAGGGGVSDRPPLLVNLVENSRPVVETPSGPVGVIEFTPMRAIASTMQIGTAPVEPAVPPAETRELYFSQRPMDFLVDPMALLTEQKSNDVSRFLEYHAEGAPFDICLMVLRENEQVPDDVSLKERHREWFGDERVALVVYPLGRPRQTMFEFGAAVRDSVSAPMLGRIEQSCMSEAAVGHDPSDQVEQLSIELSVRLYWLARILDRPQSMSEAAAAEAADRQRNADNEAGGEAGRSMQWAWVFLAALLTVAVGGLVSWLARRNSLSGGPVFFPDREMPVRLGGASSGGACAEVSFQFAGDEAG